MIIFICQTEKNIQKDNWFITEQKLDNYIALSEYS